MVREKMFMIATELMQGKKSRRNRKNSEPVKRDWERLNKSVKWRGDMNNKNMILSKAKDFHSTNNHSFRYSLGNRKWGLASKPCPLPKDSQHKDKQEQALQVSSGSWERQQLVLKTSKRYWSDNYEWSFQEIYCSKWLWKSIYYRCIHCIYILFLRTDKVLWSCSQLFIIKLWETSTLCYLS